MNVSSNDNSDYPKIPVVIQKEEDFNFKAFLSKLFSFWPWILIGGILGFSVSFTKNIFESPVYLVEGTLVIKDEVPSSDFFTPGGFGYGYSNMDEELGILKSYSLAEQTVKEMNLNVRYFVKDRVNIAQIYGNTPIFLNYRKDKPMLVGGMFKLKVLDSKRFELTVISEGFSFYDPRNPLNSRKIDAVNLPNSIFSFNEPIILLELFEFSVSQISSIPGDEILFSFQDNASLAREMRGKINAKTQEKYSSIITLSMITPLPKMGEDYINQLMRTYLNRELQEKNLAVENTIKFITDQLKGISDSLQYSENRLQLYRSENKIFNLSEEGSAIFEKLEDIEKQKSEAQLNLKYLNTLKTYVNKNQLGDWSAPSMVGISDPILISLVENISSLRTEQQRLKANFSEQTPAVKDINSRIENAQKALDDNLKSAILSNENILAELNRRILEIESEIRTLPETERNLIGIQRQFTINENIYIYLLQKKAEAEITLASNLPKNVILDQAQTVGQIGPNKNKNLFFGLVLGLLIPITLIALKEYLNNKIEDPNELEKLIKVPLIGIIGRNTSSDKLPVINSPRSPITESFRSLRADLAYLSPHKDKLCILVTSPISGEGKTFLSVNLASVFSLMGKKTILLGLDLRKPRIAQDFNLTNDKGMSTCLISDISWKEVVKSSGHENLDIILSGPIPPNPAELLLQDRFTDIISEIKENYDIVVFDCPPVGLVSETKQLFAFSDINFFIFRQGFSDKGNVQILNNLVEKGGVTKIYGILNDVHMDKGYGYGYAYAYGNGYGYHQDKKLPRWKRFLRIKN
ncbi:protein involved in gliding motility EpsB [Algoriphagus boseongensis]|uniref:non-specific protein-tyrosine kinase n=1 Tax=Algoriphagus boseongensis TaxID=1442587 RepID=A0A4R6TB12_9BACT|nr:tyrosine-protein kinase [Algoriphagus boseongensis]TDQ19399.1 protein involved in gliding motility EpsB [Algoriphagus boseongensis]